MNYSFLKPDRSVLSNWILFFIAFSTLILSSCTDECETTRSYILYEPVFQTTEEIRSSFDILPPQLMETSGKIYLKGNILFINEPNKGIHMYNNADQRNPQSLGFINIPGNFDMAAKGNYLYADSFVDLLVIDISDVNNVVLTKRIEGVFPRNWGWWDGSTTILVDYVESEIVEVAGSDCNGTFEDFVFIDGGGIMALENSDFSFASAAVQSVGIGGSMARFTISGDYLYTIDDVDLNVFNIVELSDPDLANTIEIEWGIETIFPYEDKLFIGARNGMHIFDNSNPTNPLQASTFLHVRSCDPVVVQDDLAYVTLRGGFEQCDGFTNQLDVIDVSDIYVPELLATHPMEFPNGLGIDGTSLFICEGEFGFKVFDATDPLTIGDNLLQRFDDIHAFDVIPFNNTLMMIGNDGLYQYDYTDPENLELLSIIAVNSQ